MARIRVMRVLIYEGDAIAVQHSLKHRAVKGRVEFGTTSITEGFMEGCIGPVEFIKPEGDDQCQTHET